MHVVLIEHDQVELLYPFALTHGAWEIRAGLFRIVDRWRTALPSYRVHVHTHRVDVLASFVSRESAAGSAYDGGPTLIMFANVLISPHVMRQIAELCSTSGNPLHFMIDEQTVGVFLPGHHGGLDEIPASVDRVDVQSLDAVQISGHLITRMYQVLDRISECVAWDASLLSSCVSNSANIHPTVVMDDSRGPVIVGDRVTIGPYSVLEGPIAIDADCAVKPHAHLTASIFGPNCRVAGEVVQSVFHGYSNKQHSGFIGHSYIGEWVNLGAGTTTSNLKHTYSHVHPRFPWGREDSQRMFLGTLMGDHTRTSIGTLLPTGSVYGACTAILTTSPAPSSLRSFSWDHDRYDPKKALSTAEIAMARRNKELTAEESHLLNMIETTDASQ